MPELIWKGKEQVMNHHLEVPVRCLDRRFTYNAEESENRIIHGDNLEALKALLPEYEGRVKCIYIDPPYNTGNESWVYNDNVKDPRIVRWLGEVVGKEAEDFCRHDKWLCMMYPRLQLLKRLLANDGVIFVSIDDTEQASLRVVFDEIFGRGNFIANIVWQKAYTSNQTAKFISNTHDHIIAYGKNISFSTIGKISRTEEQKAKFKNPDNDFRGPWKAENLSAGKFYSAGQFKITGPTGIIFEPPKGRYWRCNEEQYNKWLHDDRITFGKNNTGRPMLKKFLSEMVAGLTPPTWWPHEEFGSNKQASIELKAIFSGDAVFDTPKPVSLIEKILQIASDKNSIILDSFAGSGTTAHAVLNLNKKDNGNRKFILIEMMDYAETITAERVRRVIDGYGADNKAVPGTGGDFSYYTLGERIFDDEDNLNESIGIAKDSGLRGPHGTASRRRTRRASGLAGRKRPHGVLFPLSAGSGHLPEHGFPGHPDPEK
ncbi:site-specific DNA-methyltransferase (adenine-specific) [Candidatus Electrothrix gigas]